jgi:GNAT superfamily N-acetyltransferase
VIEIREVTVSPYLDSMAALIDEDWQETESHLVPEGITLNRKMFAALEAAGVMHSLLVFDDDKIVGHCVLVVSPHIHYALTSATVTTFFVSKPYRKGRLGIKLLDRAEEIARREGARFLSCAAKPDTALGAVLLRRGFRVEDITHIKEI